MSSRSWLAVLLCLMTAVNAGFFVVNVSHQSKATVAGMSYEELMRDPDFTRAVKSIAEACKVNVDIGKLAC
jgi:hypothetical protein